MESIVSRVMEIIDPRWWTLCIYGDDGDYVSRVMMEIMYPGWWWRLCIQGDGDYVSRVMQIIEFLCLR